MNKKWFGFTVFMLVFSSITTFLYFVALYISPFIMIPNVSKELMTVAILTGVFIGSTMMYFSIKALYRHGTKVKIIKEEPLNMQEFDKLLDDIKLTKIGPEMMNHVKECQRCTEMSMALNSQVSKHIEENNKLV